MEISLTEENYLKAIFSLQKQGDAVTTNGLSNHLNNKAATITDMLKKLSAKKLILYKKYNGVVLTPKGESMAVSIVRKHRLWEVFLLEKLRFKWDEVHDIAEQLEHIRSDELTNRLDEFLGYPKYDPHGDPIPDSRGLLALPKNKPLNAFTGKGSYVFTGVGEHSPSFLQHLSGLGLKIGDIISVEKINDFDRSLTVKLNRNTMCYLSEKVSSKILVKKR